MSEKTNKNLFEKSPESNKPKFRELVEQRMNKIMEEENYKVVENKKIDATTSLDKKGRPKTFRNIINQRVEDYTEGTLDIDSVNTTETDNYSTFVTNSINTNVTLPSSPKEKVLEDIKSKSKSNLTYTERKILNQDNTQKNNVLESANSLDERRKVLESGMRSKKSSRESEDYIEGIEIPVHFNRELKITDHKSGDVIMSKYKNTIDGRHDFVIWLKLNGIYDRVEKRLPSVTGDQSILKEKLDEEAKIKRVSIRATLQNESGFKVDRPQPVKVKKPKQPKSGLIDSSSAATPVRSDVVSKEVAQTSKQKHPTLKNEVFNNKNKSAKPVMGTVPQPVETKNFLTKQTTKPLFNLQTNSNPTTKQTNNNTNKNVAKSTTTKQTSNIPKQDVKKQITKNEISNVVKSAAKNIKHRTPNNDVEKLQKEILLLKQELLTKKVNRDVYNTIDFDEDVNKGFSDADVLFGLEEFEPTPSSRNQLQLVKSNIQPDTISTSVDVSRIIKLKSKLRENDSSFPFSSMSFVVKALSNALEKFPAFNAKFDQAAQQSRPIKKHDIGIIIETDEKSVVPVIHTANGLSIKELGTQLIGITSDIRRGRKLVEEKSTIKIGTFVGSASFMKPTLSNDNVAIIAMSKIVKKPFEFGGKMYSKASMNLILTYDQRAASAESANEFVNWIKYLLQTPEILTLS
ncbi:2-oxo acid dehydrogenase subunit E2 [Spiroplasma endosymbiont of Othius punctulatus]|uniref:2-oxo acid dehydrogenase subunit E2 n=1 Tax=Spiroplasma endosymbiont of Othius punctulatus TaxID=3066289 RepID=UPI0030CB9073